MSSATDHGRPPSKRRVLSRRAFIASGVGTAATAAVPTALAQNGEGDDYTGLFMQVVNVEATEDINVGVASCDIFADDAEIMAYETRLIDRIEDDRQSTSAIIYVEEGNEEVHEGKLFVVDSQQPCPENFIALRLERIGAGVVGDIEGQNGTGGDGGQTDTRTPGFGIGTALLGLGGASLVALGRLVD